MEQKTKSVRPKYIWIVTSQINSDECEMGRFEAAFRKRPDAVAYVQARIKQLIEEQKNTPKGAGDEKDYEDVFDITRVLLR